MDAISGKKSGKKRAKNERKTTATSYDSPHQSEPLLPDRGLTALRRRAAPIEEASRKLGARAHPHTLAVLRELVRAMNSYYSNRIEGQGTHPLNIERALRNDFSDKPDVAKLQRIALAHIEAETELERKVDEGTNPLLSAFAIDAHRALYSRLQPSDRTNPEGVVVQPGQLRESDVDVGRHIPPTWKSVPRFLSRFDEVYGTDRSWDERLVAIACAHQRLVWVHPFLDGNGRAARLQTHCALWPISAGLWSPNRGLARRREEYYARLADADEPRRGDLDGRGNLSQEGLYRWCDFFLDVCEDQVSFMTGMFDLEGIKRRIGALVTYRASQDKQIRPAAALPLYHLLAAGPLTRKEFQQMTGLGERVARSLLSRLLATGLVSSEGGYGPVSFAAPLNALQLLFPGLYPEVDSKQE
jgi:Fic family protein